MEFIVTQEMIDLATKVIPAVFVPVGGVAIGALKYQWSRTKQATNERIETLETSHTKQITDLKQQHEQRIQDITTDHQREVAYMERRMKDLQTDFDSYRERLENCEANLRRCEERWRRPDSFLV